MSDSYESNIKKMCDLFSAQIVSEMTLTEINNTFQKLHEKNLAYEKRIEELESIVETQVYPSMGDGYSGDYVSGYEHAIFDILKKFRKGGEL
jgi:hypothetical protein